MDDLSQSSSDGSVLSNDGTPRETFSGYYAAECTPLSARGINEETCRKFGYRVGTHGGSRVHLAPYFRGSELVAVKVRTKDKQFRMLGDGKAAPLFGSHLWSNGKMLVVTEGEIDALSVSQVQGNKWPVISIPNGAASAAKTFAANLEYLHGFDKVVLFFDADEPGRLAAKAAAEVLPPGKAFIVNVPSGAKDANDLLQQGRGAEIINAIWQAAPYRPDGIVGISDIKDTLFKPVELGRPWPWETMTRLSYGRRYGEIYGFGAGVGVGKTDLFTQTIAYDIDVLKEPVGVIYLEQPVAETVQRVAGKLKGKSFHIPDAGWTEEEYRTAVDELEATGKLWLYNHFGSMDWETIREKIRYLRQALNIRHIYLDHLTALASQAEDERRELDKIMAQMAGLAQEIGVIIHFISHLTTPDGKPHEEGGRVMEKHFTGSRAIARWSHYMFGLERNKQAEDEDERRTMTVRVLKDRYTGQATGKTFPLVYNPSTGLLAEGDEVSPF